MKSASRLVDATCMSESATLLDEPQVRTSETKAVTTVAEPATEAVSAATEAADLNLDALLREVSSLAESVEKAGAAGQTDNQAARPAASGPEESELVEAIQADPPATPPQTLEAREATTAEPPAEHAERNTPLPAPSPQHSAVDPACPPENTASRSTEHGASETNPWADEVAQMENGWASGKAQEGVDAAGVTGERTTAAAEKQPADAAAASIEAEPQKTARNNSPGLGKRLVQALAPAVKPALAGLVLALVVLDRPFTRLGPGLKNVVGYAAIATMIVASACWILAPRLRSMIE